MARSIRSGPVNLLHRLRLRFAAQWAVRRARADTGARMQHLAFKRLLVLCHGNIYRSPLVASCLNEALSDSSGAEIRSAGFHPEGGRLPREEFIQEVRDLVGVDLSGHRSRVVDISDVRWADSIIIMDRHNWHRLAKLDPLCLAKVVWLGVFAQTGPAEIVDPYGLPPPEVRQVIDKLVTAAKGFISEISLRQRQLMERAGGAEAVDVDSTNERG